jgi:hypothetical protein
MAVKFQGGRAIPMESQENATYKREIIQFSELTKQYQRALFRMHAHAKQKGSTGLPMAPASLIQQIEKADDAVEMLSMTLVALAR